MPGASAGGARFFRIRHLEFALRNSPAFSLIEIMVVVSLLSLIVLALMEVFSSTQRAFRASVTQADVLEGSRAAVDLIASDLRNLTPSGDVKYGAVNFFVLANSTYYTPLPQSLPGTYPVVYRTNLLNYFFALGRQNTKWTAVGYIVDTSSSSPLYPLYRFYAETNTANSPQTLYDLFANQIYYSQFTNMSHIIDGVIHLTLRAQDPNGNWINPAYTNALNAEFVSPAVSSIYGSGYGEAQFYTYDNTVPAALELELGVLEDQTLARAESRGIAGSAPKDVATQWQYLQGQAGTVHVFRQRVTIPNVDRTAYQ